MKTLRFLSQLSVLRLSAPLFVGAAVFSAGLLVDGPAAAQTAGGDAVYLKDGSVIKGKITEVKEGSHILVQVEGGQVARVRWDFVVRMERAGTTPAPVPAPVVAPTQQQTVGTAIPAAASPQDTVIVHIDAPDPVNLELVEGRERRLVCTSPCDIAVPLRANYRIAGSVRASRTFSLTGTPGERVTLHVDPSSKGGFAGGIVLVSLGGASLFIGLFVYLIAAAVDSIEGESGDGGKAAGLVMMGLGAAGVGGGIALIAANGSSKVEQLRGSAATGQPAAAKVRFPEASPNRDPWAGAAAPSFTLPMMFKF